MLVGTVDSFRRQDNSSYCSFPRPPHQGLFHWPYIRPETFIIGDKNNKHDDAVIAFIVKAMGSWIKRFLDNNSFAIYSPNSVRKIPAGLESSSQRQPLFFSMWHFQKRWTKGMVYSFAALYYNCRNRCPTDAEWLLEWFVRLSSCQSNSHSFRWFDTRAQQLVSSLHIRWEILLTKTWNCSLFILKNFRQPAASSNASSLVSWWYAPLSSLLATQDLVQQARFLFSPFSFSSEDVRKSIRMTTDNFRLAFSFLWLPSPKTNYPRLSRSI